MPQLDSLRAIAVAMVIWSHWAGYHLDKWSDTFWFNGQVGVQLFFVLSGFLITGILLEEKRNATSTDSPVSHILKVFYVRRFLRIFPLFYATLFIAYFLKQPDVVVSIKWHLAYLSNVFFARNGQYLETVSHFWSLAVEEQFYIFWPVLILLTPQRLLYHLIIGVVLMAPIFRFCSIYFFSLNDVAVNVLPFSSLDTLGLGSLLALMKQPRDSYSSRNATLVLQIICILSLAGYVITGIFASPEWKKTLIGDSALRMMLAPALLGIVWLTSQGVRGIVGRFLNWSVLIFLGKISYGIYILHFFIPYATSTYFYQQNYLFWDEVGVLPYFLMNLSILLVLCSISWFFFESKIISLKKYFPYQKKIPRVVTSAVKAVDVQQEEAEILK